MDDTRRKKIRDLIRQMERECASGIGDRPQRVSMAQIQLELAEEQAESADKLERETTRLVEETVELRRLTRGLYIFTIAVAFFAVIQIVIMLLEYCSKLHGSP